MVRIEAQISNVLLRFASRAQYVVNGRLTADWQVKNLSKTRGNTIEIQEGKLVIMRDVHVIPVRHDLGLQFKAPIVKEHTGVPSKNVAESNKMLSYDLFLLIVKTGNISRDGGDTIRKTDSFESSLASLGRLKEGLTISTFIWIYFLLMLTNGKIATKGLYTA